MFGIIKKLFSPEPPEPKVKERIGHFEVLSWDHEGYVHVRDVRTHDPSYACDRMPDGFYKHYLIWKNWVDEIIIADACMTGSGKNLLYGPTGSGRVSIRYTIENFDSCLYRNQDWDYPEDF